MKKRPVRLNVGSPDEQKLRHALTKRAQVETPAIESTHAVQSDAARTFWSERAWSEYAAVPAMSQTILAMIREGSSTDALGAITAIANDEVKHTELSRDVAEALGGYVEDPPAFSAYEPQILGEPRDVPLAYWVVGNGCISETASLELMRARAKYGRHPLVASVLERICKDEAVHAQTSWTLAETIIPKLAQQERRSIAEYACGMFEALGATFATRALPRAARRKARKIREETSALSLGACPPDEEDAVVIRTITGVIVPRLQKLGLPL